MMVCFLFLRGNSPLFLGQTWSISASPCLSFHFFTAELLVLSLSLVCTVPPFVSDAIQPSLSLFQKSRSSTVDVTRLLLLSLDRWTSCSCHQVVVVRVADVSKIKSGRNSSQHTPAWYALRIKHACNI